MDNELKSLQKRHNEWINIFNRGDAFRYSFGMSNCMKIA